jgi:hypothetical protein
MGFMLCLPAAAQIEPSLGEPPHRPKDLSKLPQSGPSPQLVTGGFSVDASSREQVRSFYNAVYLASEGVPINSTAIVSSCVPGTNDPAYYEGVLRRINWYRAMAGVPAVESFNTNDCTHDQAAALIMSANTNLSHFPPATWSCFTGNGANAASNSNLALSFVGPDAINSYVQDFGGNNYPNGHRRWLLYPQTQIMGTGDVPPQGNYLGANATWVLDANYGGPRPPTRAPYVSWPPPGFTPYGVVFPRWTIAYPNADFSKAIVTMTSNGVPVSVRQEVYDPNSYGENTLVWVPMGLDANNFYTTWPFSGSDTVYSVTVSNVANASSGVYSYTVTVFDPAIPGADYVPSIISGSNQVAVGQSNGYCFPQITNASSYQWLLNNLSSFNFLDGAETGLSNFGAALSPGYNCITNTVVAAGAEAFHLAMPTPGDQVLSLNHTVTPGTNGVLSFSSLLGLATATQVARVQATTNAGLSWVDLYTRPGDSTWGESAFSTHAVSLANMAGQSVQLRFGYFFQPGTSYYADVDTGYPGYYAGWYLDNIVVSNCQELVSVSTNSIPSTNFNFSASAAGNYALQARPLMFMDYPLGWGPLKLVSAAQSAPVVISLSQPAIVGSQLRLDFALQSGAFSGFHLLSSSNPGGPWSTNSAATFSTNVAGASYRFTVSTPGSAQFYRVQAP